jgi:hypothetical protein
MMRMEYRAVLCDIEVAARIGLVTVNAYNPKEACRKAVKEVGQKLSLSPEQAISQIDYIIDAKQKRYNPASFVSRKLPTL